MNKNIFFLVTALSFFLSMHSMQFSQKGREIASIQDLMNSAIENDDMVGFNKYHAMWRRAGGYHTWPLFRICAATHENSLDMMASFLKMSGTSENNRRAIDLNWLDNYGESLVTKAILSLPLQYTKEEQQTMLKKVQMLVWCGVEVSSKDKLGYTAVDYAYGEVTGLTAQDGRRCPLIYTLYEYLQELMLKEVQEAQKSFKQKN